LAAINKDRPILANRVLATTRKWFNFMIAKDIIKTLSPCAGVEAPAKENSRERVLTNEEIAALWMASDQVDGIFGPFTKLLVLTGQRRSEVAGMRMSEIDTEARTWTLPGERTKNGEQHSVPLSSQAWAIIEAARSGTGDHVLSGTGKTAISGFSKAKRVIDRIVNFRTPWTWHDIRRSVVTHLADDLAVPPHIIEAAVNHISGHKAGVAGVYNRATYAVEKRDALQAWADHIDTIVAKAKATPGDKVIRGKFAKRRA
jgi:integrase